MYVSAENVATGEQFRGWVSCGSHIFEPSYLMLADGVAVAMPRRRRRATSRVNIMEEGGVRRDVDIEVNHPARVGSWRIYQVSYDIAKGRWSDTSVLECVRDPWYGAAHVALAAAGFGCRDVRHGGEAAAWHVLRRRQGR